MDKTLKLISKEFLVNGRMVEYYYLSNKEMVDLLETDLSNEDKEFLNKEIIKRFKYHLCPKAGEDNHDVFARFFSNFVNGQCHNKMKVAKLMANDHRYLQQEMFLLFLNYVEILSENYNNGLYDKRNEYSCQIANKIMEIL